MPTSRGFSYVGLCQSVVRLHRASCGWMARLSRGAQAPHPPPRSGGAGGEAPSHREVKQVSTAKRPPKGHSAIRVREVRPPSPASRLPTHEIKYGRSDAHSHSRALTVEVLAQKPQRAVAPRFSLRGPGNTHSSWSGRARGAVRRLR